MKIIRPCLWTSADFDLVHKNEKVANRLINQKPLKGSRAANGGRKLAMKQPQWSRFFQVMKPGSWEPGQAWRSSLAKSIWNTVKVVGRQNFCKHDPKVLVELTMCGTYLVCKSTAYRRVFMSSPVPCLSQTISPEKQIDQQEDSIYCTLDSIWPRASLARRCSMHTI